MIVVIKIAMESCLDLRIKRRFIFDERSKGWVIIIHFKQATKAIILISIISEVRILFKSNTIEGKVLLGKRKYLINSIIWCWSKFKNYSSTQYKKQPMIKVLIQRE